MNEEMDKALSTIETECQLLIKREEGDLGSSIGTCVGDMMLRLVQLLRGQNKDVDLSGLMVNENLVKITLEALADAYNKAEGEAHFRQLAANLLTILLEPEIGP